SAAGGAVRNVAPDRDRQPRFAPPIQRGAQRPLLRAGRGAGVHRRERVVSEVTRPLAALRFSRAAYWGESAGKLRPWRYDAGNSAAQDLQMSMHEVNWHEGMFLVPHHFQAAHRHALRMLHEHSRLDLHYNW